MRVPAHDRAMVRVRQVAGRSLALRSVAMTDHDAELDAIVAMLTAAGHIIVVERPDGDTDYQLTETGIRVARQLAMSSEADQDALLAALLDAQAYERGPPLAGRAPQLAALLDWPA